MIVLQRNNANNESWVKTIYFPGGGWKSRWWRSPPHFWRLCPREIRWLRARLCSGGAFWDWSEKTNKHQFFIFRQFQLQSRCWARATSRSLPRCVDLKYPALSQALATWLLSSTGEVKTFYFLDFPLTEQTNKYQRVWILCEWKRFSVIPVTDFEASVPPGDQHRRWNNFKFDQKPKGNL